MPNPKSSIHPFLYHLSCLPSPLLPKSSSSSSQSSSFILPSYPTPLQLQPSQNSTMMQPILDTDRDIRLSKAVALVTNRKYSVRKAAQALQLPKSTVHRYLQATRGHLGVTKRPRSRRTTRPAKCDISFLVESDHSDDWWQQPSSQQHIRQQPSPPQPAPQIFTTPFPVVRPRSCAPEIPPFHPPCPVPDDAVVRKLPSIST